MVWDGKTCTGEPEKHEDYTPENALGWRLPKKEELESISCQFGECTVVFPATPRGKFAQEEIYGRRYVCKEEGIVFTKTNCFFEQETYFVRLVRDK